MQTRWIASGLILAWSIAAPGFAAEGEEAQTIPTQGNLHLQSPGSPHPPYNSIPPTSGPHVPWLASWGMHRIPIPWQVQVHNLEDGGVIIHYRCDNPCPDVVAALEQLVASYPGQVIATPEPHLSSKFALTAWARLATADEFDENVMRRFIEAYRGLDHHPPQEHGGATSGQ